MKLWIKYCGICRTEDFANAVTLGVDAVGLICVPESPRVLDNTQLKTLAMLPRNNSKVTLVFENPTEKFVKERMELSSPNLLQFHGNESPEFAASFGMPYIKAVRNRQLLSQLRAHVGALAWLVDDSDLIDPLVMTTSDKPVILAGKLTSKNVADRIRAIQPFGVDVSSGIESAPRVKDIGLMSSFLAEVRNVETK